MPSGFLMVFCLFWSGIVLVFDGSMVRPTWQQFESGFYSSVEGKVTANEVKSHRGSRGGKWYAAEITYVYQAGTENFTGKRLRYTNPSSHDYSDAFAIASAHPVGAGVMVYYNPAQPGKGVLFPGLNGSDMLGFLFLTPFNAVMLALWTWGVGWLRARWIHPVAGGVKLISDGMVTRVRLPRCSACWWGLGVTGGLGAVAALVVGIPINLHSSNLNPSAGLGLGAMVLVYGGGLAVYLWQKSKINSGIADLIIDESSRTVQLPLTFGRQAPVTVKITDIKSVWIQAIVRHNRKGGVTYTYAPTLQLSGRAGQKLAEWWDDVKAGDFAGWLGKQIRVPVKD